MNPLSKTLLRALPVLVAGAFVLAPSADAHGRHHGHRKHVYRAPCAVPGPVYAPRVVYRPQPVYRGSPVAYHASLGVYLSGVSVGVSFGNVPPAGYVYADPYCGGEFVSVRAYHRHLRRYPHAAHLTVVSRAPSCRYEDDGSDRYDGWHDDDSSD